MKASLIFMTGADAKISIIFMKINDPTKTMHIELT